MSWYLTLQILKHLRPNELVCGVQPEYVILTVGSFGNNHINELWAMNCIFLVDFVW